jgi:hypothetical protein
VDDYVLVYTGRWFGTFGVFFHIFPYIGKNNPNWHQLTNVFSEGLKPPTRLCLRGLFKK